MGFLFSSGPKTSSAPPAIGALNIQQSSYGTPITLMGGTNRISGNMLWYDDFNAVQVNTGGSSGGGGKGGGSSSSASSTSYNYFASFIIGMCEGPINRIGQVWESKSITDVPTLGGTVFTGTEGQSPWGYLTTNHPDKAIGYNNTAYVAYQNFALGTSADTPNLSAEVFASPDATTPSQQDMWPSDWLTNFLTRAAWPVTYLATLSATPFDVYTKAMGFGISPVCDQQRPASDWLNEWMATLNSEFVWSDGKLSAVPYGDSVVNGNGANYVPNLTPQYDLADDDFIITGDEDPVTCNRTDLADAYNQVPIEYINKGDQYNIETFTAQDQAHIDQFGERQAPTVQAHHCTDPVMAQLMANLILWRGIYVRTTYQFKLGWKHILLDPMDLVTITDAALGLNRELVRITEIEEDENGMLTITAEEMPGDIAAPAVYPSQSTTRFNPNYTVDPGNVATPAIFEAPLALVQKSAVEIWLAVSGPSANWGGCDVWVSNDDTTYSFVDRIQGRSRQGVLTSILGTGAALDTTSSIKIDLTESLGALGSASNTDANSLNTLAYVDGELLAYGNVSLLSQYKYNLTYLQRGAYNTPIASHAVGSQFARLDQAIFKYPVDQSRIGQTLYFKFVSFNLYGGGIQSLDEVAAYTYKVTGVALLTPLPNVTNLAVNYNYNIAQLSWTPVADIRYPILYQIRKGSTFASAQVIDVTTQATYPVFGNDTYFVTALYITPLGVPVYSTTPPSIAVSTASLTQNLIETVEDDPTWSGTVAGGAEVSGTTIILRSGNILDAANILPIPNVLQYTDVVASGMYTSANTITSAYVCNAKVMFNWTLLAESVTSDVVMLQDVPTTADMTGLVSSSLVYAIPQVRMSVDGGSTYGAWQNWKPGVYTFNALQYRILIYTLDPQTNAILTTLGLEADVPPRVDSGTDTSPASSTNTLSFPGGTFNVPDPVVQIQILNKQNGDYDVISSITASGFTYNVQNAGVNVVRSITYTASAF